MTNSSNLSAEGDGNVKIEEWTDMRCLKISHFDTFPAIVKDIQVQKNIISRFLNFYLGGKIQKGLSVKDVIFSVIAIMPVSLCSENFIWDEEEYNEKGTLFFLTPDDKLRDEIECVLNKKTVDKKILQNEETVSNGDEETCSNGTDFNKEKGISLENMEISDTSCDSETVSHIQVENVAKTENGDINTGNDMLILMKMENENEHNVTSTVKSCMGGGLQWYRKKYDSQPEKSPITEIEYGPVENAAFCISCNKLLTEWESSIAARTALKYFFAMAALVVMRSTVKSYQNLTKYFATKFSKNLISSEMEAFTTPHKGFLKKSWKAFREPDLKTGIMFSKLVINSFLQRDRLNGFGKQNILSFAVLSHTADFGMGIISLLQLIANVTLNFKLLFESLYSEETAVSWHRVDDFFKNYMSQTARQFTFHWARVIENEHFKHLSCTENYALAAVIAVYVEKQLKEPGVWQSSWVSKGENLEAFKQLGYKLYEDYVNKKHDSEKLQLQFLLGD